MRFSAAWALAKAKFPKRSTKSETNTKLRRCFMKNPR
jgi:hypothetical protein